MNNDGTHDLGEDRNANILDLGEDINFNGILDKTEDLNQMALQILVILISMAMVALIWSMKISMMVILMPLMKT